MIRVTPSAKTKAPTARPKGLSMLRGLFRAGCPRAVLTAPPQAMAAAVKPPPTDLVLHQEGVILRAGQPQDFVAWARARTASRADITVWEPDWRDKDMTRTAFLRRLRADARQWRAGRRYSFFTLEEGTERLLGGISLSDVRRGNRQAGMLGYWVANGETGRGVGTRAVAGVAHFAFNRLHLNRLEAACQPGNLGSRRILEKNGFACEGIMRRYLRINGHWCDHEIWARVQG